MRLFRIIKQPPDAQNVITAVYHSKRSAKAEAARLRAEDRVNHYRVEETRRRGDCLEVKTVWSSALAELAKVSPLRGNLRDDG